MLEIRSISKTYRGGNTALKDFSLSAGEGVIGLLGPNGAGKTTLLSILATILKPTSGTFVWDGIDGTRDPEAVRRVLGYLPQDFGVYDSLTAEEFLTYIGRLKGMIGPPLKENVHSLLELVNLRSHARRRLGSFSGGMRQRIGIAQALLGDPKLIVVDEPTVGLDPEERVRFRNLLSELAHGRLVILSTHIVSDVEATAEKIAVIRGGELVSFTTAEALIRRATGRVFRTVVRPEDLPEAQRRLAVSGLTRKADGVHIRFVGDPPPGAVVSEVEPTLEDAYLLTSGVRAGGEAEAA